MKQLGAIIIILFFISGCGKSNKHSYQGYVEGENIYLASPFSGVLKKMCVQRGAHVKKGQLLFELDKNPEEMMIEESRAAMLQQKHLLEDAKLPKRKPELDAIKWKIIQADAQINLATLRVKRYETLVQKHALDKDSLDGAKEHYQELIALRGQREDELLIAQMGARDQQIKALNQKLIVSIAKVRQAEWAIEQKSLYATDDGVIFDTYYRVGEFVNTGRPVGSLLTPSNIRIEFFVPLAQATMLKLGQKMSFTCDGCDKKNTAVIRYISPDAEYIPPLVYSRDNNDKLVFRVKANIDNPSLFKPGQPVIISEFSHE